MAYVMIRGPQAGWYPYPFLDPANGGYLKVAVDVVAILIFGAALSAMIVVIGNRPRLAGDRLARSDQRDRLG